MITISIKQKMYKNDNLVKCEKNWFSGVLDNLKIPKLNLQLFTIVYGLSGINRKSGRGYVKFTLHICFCFSEVPIIYKFQNLIYNSYGVNWLKLGKIHVHTPV